MVLANKTVVRLLCSSGILVFKSFTRFLEEQSFLYNCHVKLYLSGKSISQDIRASRVG